MADDHEHDRAREDGDEGIGVQGKRERLHQGHHAKADQRRRRVLPGTPAEELGRRHLRTAPKVMPRSRCRRSRKVKTTIGIRNSVVAAATAGQSCPPSPMMNGMNGGMVCASPLVSRSANAYSFQEKMRQKIAVAAMPVAACGRTTLVKD